MMSEREHWRLEMFLDEEDPFGTPVWYVLEGEILIAQSEMRTVAEKILRVHEEHRRFEFALRQIVSLSTEDAPSEELHHIARRALESDSE
jgi:hypothetical protein